METSTVVRAFHTFPVAVEIERKWVAERRPDVVPPDLHGTHLRQGYLAEEGDVTVRVRISDDLARLTVKAGAAAARTEVEVDIDRQDAEDLWPYTEGRRILKTRYRVPLADGLVAEVDVFEADLAGLCIVEVEFPSPEAARGFVAPEWFGRDVTEVKGWSNADLARHGRPDD
jgi:CYTH domain-containing protein